MEFKNFEEFNQNFKNGKFSIENSAITINDVNFRLLSSSRKSWEEILNGQPGIIIYSATHKHAGEAIEAGMNEWLALIWLVKGNAIVPVDVRPTTPARIKFQLRCDDPDPHTYRGTSDEAIGEAAEPNTIGSIVRVKVMNLPSSSELKGKVDTGATISSLHAERYKINGDKIQFVCPELSPNVISMPLSDRQSVKSADGGVEYRPVVLLNIKVNDQLMQDVQFNLNDRGQMQYPMLVGQNILEKGKYLIDPSIQEGAENENEEIDWDTLYENLGEISVDAKEPMTDEEVKGLLEYLERADITFADLMAHAKTNLTESLFDVTY